MTQTQLKPLNWTPTPGIGYTVARRTDGGMQLTFTDVSHETLLHWRDFAMQHLEDSDQLTRNLYDLAQVEEITEEAIQFAVEANSDPSTRNIRLAVVVANEQVREGILEIAALSTSPGGGSNMKLFTDIDEAETWLSRPLDTMT
ncbi:MAG TPA: hypothetical protein VI451_10125 [Anaerolineales bacterium]|jgi:hypothetical protein|nr:hypothetical protein [Anaerolineales bacterium]